MKHTKILVSLLALCCLSMPLTACNNETTSDSTSEVTAEKEVSSLTVKTMPTKTEYYVGDEFDATGCVITITYTDGSTEDVDLTDSRLGVVKPSMDSEGTKNVIVSYGGKRVTFKITVSIQTFTVTFDYNYEGSTPLAVTVNKGEAVSEPDEPTRENYLFDGWYTDTTLANAYDFSTLVTADITLYAKWLDNSVTNYTFTFDLNWYGVSPDQITQKVEEGKTATKIEDPTRKGYDFDGWYTEAEGTTAYDFTAAVTADTTVYAKWTRNSEYSGEQTYTFEAEDVSLKGKTGKGLSGTVTEKGMIITNTEVGASNDRFVGYMYKAGLSLKFVYYSDIAVTNAKLVLRLSQEVEAYTYNKDNFQILAGGVTQTYSDIVFTADEVPASNAEVPYAQCKDFTITEALSIKAGRNVITLTVSNMDAITGTTMEAHAPIIDAVKITTTGGAVLGWDGNDGLPADNY